MKLQNVKGSNDYLPFEQQIRNYINDVLKSTFEEYGYLPIETPILCYYDMLSGKYDETNDLLKEIYQLRDQGNRHLGLRYDLTVPFAKFIALNKNKIKIPLKRYEISKVFRDGPVKLGRDREFTQCDADVVGISGQMIEAECLSLYVSAFQKLNIEINIQYNSRNLMIGLLLEIGIEEDLINKTVTLIDKMDKLSRKEFQEELSNLGLTPNQIEHLQNNFQLSLEELQEQYQYTKNKTLALGIEELSNLNQYLSYLNMDQICTFSPTLARGQDYYTGIVFEVYDAKKRLSGSIGAGGRYDKMITDFIQDGESYPAVGLSFGLTSIYELLKDSPIFEQTSPIDLYIIPMNTEKECLKLATTLREKGIKITIEMTNKKIKKCFEYANKEKIPYVIVIGEDELASQTVTIKQMKTGISESISITDIDKIVEFIQLSKNV